MSGLRRLAVAGHPLGLDLADAVAADAVGPVLAPLEVSAAGPAPAEVWRIHAGDEPPAGWDPAATGACRAPSGAVAVSWPEPPLLESWRPGEGPRLWGTAAAFAHGDVRAHPGSTALAAWAAARDVQVLHVGAVAVDGAAALVIGVGGAGKSTTVVAAALAGLGFIGDDLCALTLDPAPVVHPLFASVKLNPDSAEHLPLPPWPDLGVTPKGKLVLGPGAPVALAGGTRVVAVVLLDRPDGSAPALRPVPPGRTARALGATALAPALGAGSLTDWFRVAMGLARDVPGFALRLSWDLDAVVAGVVEAVERGRRTAAR